jgi:asparagine synthase (glutamine-hydrolysing)
MSGICGIYCPTNPTLASRQLLNKMLETIGHRGKAGRSLFVDESTGIAIGHVFAPTFRPPGHEDISNWHEDDHFVATLDGAIFNDGDFFPAERRQYYKCLDAGVAIEHLRQNPSTFPEKLDGHFSLTVWDKAQCELWIMRDALGGKPLYYTHLAGQGMTIFASEVKGILAHPDINRRLNPHALTAYLTFGYIPAPLSIFDGIHKVFSGEVLKCDASGNIAQRQYWTMPPLNPQEGDLETFASQLRELMVQTVAKHVDGARQIGVFLSGGLDSTIVLSALKILGIPERHTFTLGFYPHDEDVHDELWDDLHWAERAAQSFATRHHRIIIEKGHDPQIVLPRILRQYDEPILTPNAYSKYCLSEAAQQNGVNSCLSGSNAGFLFERYSRKKIRQICDAAGVGARDEEIILFNRNKLFSFEEQAALLVAPVEESREMALQLLGRHLNGIEADDINDLFFVGKFVMQGSEKAIAVQDRTPVLNDVEVRHPFRDWQLACSANLIPSRFKGGESDGMAKAVLKHAFKDVLPKEIIDREKTGYPCYYWNHGEIDELKQRLLSPAGLERTGLFRPDAVQRILEADRTSAKKSAGKRTWGLLMVQAWYELYINRNEDFLR